jgi:hypothetical protein
MAAAAGFMFGPPVSTAVHRDASEPHCGHPEAADEFSSRTTKAPFLTVAKGQGVVPACLPACRLACASACVRALRA